MPKVIELTVELNVERVSCPGVWLCQDGRVSLTVFMLGTSYETSMLPPVFPMEFKDVFYFRKRFPETGNVSNIVALLKDETIYCELVQWCADCLDKSCTILAQYLGSLNDVLFPPQMWTTDGIDLLMRRSKNFPGILSPKIEISTKVRIDEVWDCNGGAQPQCRRIRACSCTRPDVEASRQKQVCHSPLYHRVKHPKIRHQRSHSCSSRSRSCYSLKESDVYPPCSYPSHGQGNRCGSPRLPRSTVTGNCHYNVCYAEMPSLNKMRTWNPDSVYNSIDYSDWDCGSRQSSDTNVNHLYDKSEDEEKTILESRFIDQEQLFCDGPKKLSKKIGPCMWDKRRPVKKINPCTCAICRRYYEYFHDNVYRS